MTTFFYGYPRENGTYGVRNHMAVMSSVICANGVVEEIARQVPGVLPITHAHGCCGTGEIAMRTLSGMGSNPNIAALLIIGLGCEESGALRIAEALAHTGKPLEYLIIEDNGGSAKTARKGTGIARRMLKQIQQEKRIKVSVEQLTMGLKCGGSDAFSGMTANPALGAATDILVAEGGTAILSEIGGVKVVAQLLKKRAVNPEVAKKIETYAALARDAVNWSLRRSGIGLVFPGNVDGGLTTDTEKVLGGITKGGTSIINDCFPYAMKPQAKGLVLMEGTGYDIEQNTGMAASGAQVIVFTTGRGTPTGLAGVPVIKVGSNSTIWKNMKGDIDVNAGAIIDGDKTVQEAGEEIFEWIVKVASGRLTKAEKNRQNHFAICQEGYTWPSLKDIALRGF